MKVAKFKSILVSGWGIVKHCCLIKCYFRTSEGDEDERFFESDSKEAIRWLRQSENDLAGAKWLLQSRPPFNALACFHSHEVVEKCLKAMFFRYCGISSSLLGLHKLIVLAESLKEETDQERPDDTVMKWIRKVAEYYLSTRYPNRQPLSVVPAEAFDLNEAEGAVDAASKVLEYVKDCLQEQDMKV